MKVRFAALGAIVAIASGISMPSAYADGYRPRAAYAAPMLSDWTGLYLGGHFGGAWTDVDWANVNLTNERVDNDASGFIAGVQVGYNHQIGNILLGIEASAGGGSLSDDFHSRVNPVAITYSTDIHTIVTVTGRLGVVADKWLLYAKGGWAGAQVDISGRDLVLPDSFTLNDWRNGWTVGGGFEFKLAPNLSMGLEYSYMDLGSETDRGTTVALLPLLIRDHDVQIQSVTARLNYQFHRDEYRPLK